LDIICQYFPDLVFSEHENSFNTRWRHTFSRLFKRIQENPGKFDILVTDQTMPRMTGFELARKTLQIRPHLPIILCTGYSNLVDEEAAKQAGIRGFIMKPLTKKSLAELLAKVKNESGTQEQDNQI
jgi:YesN/AraC family two-component response regulator